MKPLTAAQRRALEAVQAGLVVRRYHAKGNVLTGPSEPGRRISSHTLWSLDKLGLIEDGKGCGHTYRMILTTHGLGHCNKK